MAGHLQEGLDGSGAKIDVGLEVRGPIVEGSRAAGLVVQGQSVLQLSLVLQVGAHEAEQGRIGDVNPTSEEGWMNSIIYLVGLVVVVLAVLSFFGLR